MERLVAATISTFWAAVFALLSAVSLFAADRGAAVAAELFHLPPAIDLAAYAGRPVFAGICFGAAIVSALFATVLVSSILNVRRQLAQGLLVADMAFGGAFGIAALVAAAFLVRAERAELGMLVLAGLLLAGSFRAVRWALRPLAPMPEPASALRKMAHDAAANTNVVAFPLKATATMGGH